DEDENNSNNPTQQNQNQTHKQNQNQNPKHNNAHPQKKNKKKEENLWQRREIEIPDSVRRVADWLAEEEEEGEEQRDAKVRVEVRTLGEERVWAWER
ncbi:MAG: hypothetical protein Q9193_006550, partial [Seirophora villosa]